MISINRFSSKADQYALLSGKVEKVLESPKNTLSEAQAKKLLEGLKDGKSVDSVVAELKTWCEGGGYMNMEHLRNMGIGSDDIAGWLPDTRRKMNLRKNLDTIIVIQVKAGGGKGLTTQMIESYRETGKIVVGYGPKLKPSVINSIKSEGLEVFTNSNDLIEFIRTN